MNEKLAVSIVRAIIRDIYGRYGLEGYFRSLHPRILTEIYEKWILIVSEELEKAGVIDKKYKPLKVDEMSFADVIYRSSFYLEDDDESL